PRSSPFPYPTLFRSGPLLALFNFNLSQGGGGYSSELVFASVDGKEYGVEPEPVVLPAPERFYPLGLGDTWVYRSPYFDGPAEERSEEHTSELQSREN